MVIQLGFKCPIRLPVGPLYPFTGPPVFIYHPIQNGQVHLRRIAHIQDQPGPQPVGFALEFLSRLREQDHEIEPPKHRRHGIKEGQILLVIDPKKDQGYPVVPGTEPLGLPFQVPVKPDIKVSVLLVQAFQQIQHGFRNISGKYYQPSDRFLHHTAPSFI
jgi:hypothetical protein